MRILLLTDMPPCTNYTAGIVLSQIVRSLPAGSVACFCAVDPHYQNIQLDPELDWMPLEYAAKPREAGLGPGAPLRDIRSHVAERARQADAIPRILNQCVTFARKHGCDAIWAVLEGQTMVRLVPRVADALGLPLYTHVWDPLEWWLKHHHVDRRSSRTAQAAFDATIRRSRAVATASNAMSEEYERTYGVRSVALIACHDRAHSFAPEPRMRRDDEIVIGMAGQFYANAEWQTLVRALNAAKWVVGGRSASLLVLGHHVPDSPVPPGRSRFLGWVPQNEAIRIMSEEADVLFCPYPFAPEMADVSRLSFPSKLVSYLAAGRPVVFHGPSFAAPAKYLMERGAGIVTVGSGAVNVFDALEQLATDPARYARIAAAARQAFLDDFTLERMRERALSFFETTMEALTPAFPPNRFNHAHPAARVPRSDERRPDSILLLQFLLRRLEMTPARPVIGAARRVGRGYRRMRRARDPIWSLRPELERIQADLTALREDVLRRAEGARAPEGPAEGRSDELAILREGLEASAKAQALLAEANAALSRRLDALAAPAAASGAPSGPGTRPGTGPGTGSGIGRDVE